MLRAIRLVSALAFACLAVALGLALLGGEAGASCAADCQSNLALAAGMLALFALPCGRLAVVLGLIHSGRTGRARWFALLAALCAYILVASALFTLRVNGWIRWNWALFGVPLEELGIPAEALALSSSALCYALRPGAAMAAGRAAAVAVGAPDAPPAARPRGAPLLGLLGAPSRWAHARLGGLLMRVRRTTAGAYRRVRRAAGPALARPEEADVE